MQEDNSISEEPIVLAGVDVAKLQELAEQGDATAQTILGDMYYLGNGVTADEEEAMRWYRMGADQGLARAQNNLGLAYANGCGIP